MSNKSRVLLVEGKGEVHALSELCERNGIAWGPRGREVVFIQPLDGISGSKLSIIPTKLKDSGIEHLAVILDADADPAARWQSIRDRVVDIFDDLPPSPPPDGYVREVAPGSIHISPRLRRFGVWTMPDNQSRGMLETFLLALRPEHQAPDLFHHAEAAVDRARELAITTGSNVFTPAHRDKALIHTWLAWHGNPPGASFATAIQQKVLDPKHPMAQPFVAWFRRVFELP
jgi:hypothetical protein